MNKAISNLNLTFIFDGVPVVYNYENEDVLIRGNIYKFNECSYTLKNVIVSHLVNLRLEINKKIFQL